MARKKSQVIEKARTKEVPKSRQIDENPFFLRLIPKFQNPQWAHAAAWREFVRQQPIMMACRDVLIQQLIALPWLIVANDNDETNNLKDEINYYTDVLNKWNGEDFDTGIERTFQDTLTLPFGGANELGYFKDGTLAWIKNIDASTLYPTLDPEWPVAQSIPGVPNKEVRFPAEAITRAYLSPRPEYDRKGWGMAPPEKSYLSALMLLQGDKYFWQLLIDTPEAGILDLADMEKESALEWVEQMGALLSGVDPLKIPVLYEHEGEVKFIPFQRSPADLMIDKSNLWYATLVAASFGIPLSEIGLQFAETLAGSIRDDRRGRRTGFGMMVAKAQNLINKALPKHLRFKFEFRDDESLVLLGRARSTSFTAFRQAIEAGFLSPEGAQLQARADGLLDAHAVAASPPREPLALQGVRVDQQGDDLKRPPDEGGLGEVKQIVEKSLTTLFPLYRYAVSSYGYNDVAELGIEIRSAILSKETETEIGRFIALSLPENGDTTKDEIALYLASEVLSAPWARETIRRAHRPEMLRGSTLYYKLTKMVQGVYS